MDWIVCRFFLSLVRSVLFFEPESVCVCVCVCVCMYAATKCCRENKTIHTESQTSKQVTVKSKKQNLITVVLAGLGWLGFARKKKSQQKENEIFRSSSSSSS